jgi:hypothetical protein
MICDNENAIIVFKLFYLVSNICQGLKPEDFTLTIRFIDRIQRLHVGKIFKLDTNLLVRMPT